jgi:hypothetical protein
MPLIIVRLHPVEPVSGSDFSDYLDELTISAFDISLANLDGVLLGQASFLAPEDEDEPQTPNADTSIVQHVERFALPLRRAVATAVIAVNGDPEHRTSDVRLEISRNGGTIIHQAVYYNVPMAGGDMPAPGAFENLGPTSLYLALPAPGQEVEPGEAFVELPVDGTPPSFAAVREAVETVLAQDPGDGSIDIARLTPAQSRHIAFEIVWNRELHPLPTPSPFLSLAQMYTGPQDAEDDDEAARQRFEAELSSYYAVRNAEAGRLATFVFSMSAALFAEQQSEEAARVGFSFPVRLDAAQQDVAMRAALLALHGPELALDPPFRVPAAHWYALAAAMPALVTPEQRFELAIRMGEQQILTQLNQALEQGVFAEPPEIGVAQAARRLVALGAATGAQPDCAVAPGNALQDLIQAWLDFEGLAIAAFWQDAVGPLALGPHAFAHLQLVLSALTGGHQPLIDTLELNLANVLQLAGITAQQWRDLFLSGPGAPGDELSLSDLGNGSINISLLPPFTQPGTAEERVEAFIRHVGKFFTVAVEAAEPDPIQLAVPPTLYRPADDADVFALFGGDYFEAAGQLFEFGAGLDASVDEAIPEVFPADALARAWLRQALQTIDELWSLTDIDFGELFPELPASDTPRLRFALAEGLYARSFTSRADVAALTAELFREALVGSIAYDFAEAIYANAEAEAPADDEPAEAEFSPLNSDGCLVNCIPPPQRSPFGPPAYLHELLNLSELSSCTLIHVTDVAELDALLAQRCAPPDALLVTRANLETPLPWIDLVNECLEALASPPPDPPPCPTHNTAGEQLAGQLLCAHGDHPAPAQGDDEQAFCPDPTTLFAALPEHSSPATPVAAPMAYGRLRSDFSHCLLPYSQPLDIARSYLGALGTSRFATMRAFRAVCTEFVLDPESPPEGFEDHRLREPPSEASAAEYLGINPEVLQRMFTREIVDALPAGGNLVLWELYGFPNEEIDGESWLTIVARVQEFLARTCLDYCQFRELWQSEFVGFRRAPPRDDENENAGEFPDCPPCATDAILIEFLDPPDAADALRRLIVFIRLWRLLQALPGARYSFQELRDICQELELFQGDGTINRDFVRQLAAFQRLRDLLGLPLADGDDPAPVFATGAARSYLLALADPAQPRFVWALDQVLDGLQPYAQQLYACPRRPPHFLKLLAQNMDPLSTLAGFSPEVPGDTWFAEWTHILRMVELLAKLYASSFSVGQIVYLFTADPHLHGDDPFPQQPLNEALCRPFDFADDLPMFSLMALREKLLAVEVSEQEAAALSWSRIEATLREEFGYAVPAGETDHLLSFATHFFAEVLQAEGIPVDLSGQQYRAPLAATSPPMWNTPPEGPFRYDTLAAELIFEVGTSNEAVIAKLARMRPLDAIEQLALLDVYWSPRVNLAALGFLFPNLDEADERLIQEPDQQRRWAYFQHTFAVFYARCRIIAAHFAEHVAAVSGRPNQHGGELAWQVLRHLWADENFAITSWEMDSGEVPEVTWGPQPHGGAFAALLGLVGTGLLGTYRRENGIAVWQELRGPLEAFGAAENAMNAPVPTIIPSMSLALAEDQEPFLTIRNGFGTDAASGTVIGGLEGYSVVFDGLLLVEQEGEYAFHLGAPTPPGVPPDPEQVKYYRWFFRLQQGQKVWSVLAKGWSSEQGPEYCSGPVWLRRGMYELELHFERPRLELNGPEDVCPQTTGIQIKYAGPDTGGQLLVPPHKRLYLGHKSGRLTVDSSAAVTPQQHALALQYVPTVRDMRRSANRAVKSLLIVHNHDLSPLAATDSGVSEFDFFLDHPQEFVGAAYFRQGALGFAKHQVVYDFNPLPVLDNYHPPLPAQDQRALPSAQRRAALFDVFFEALFDYTRVRAESAAAREPKAIQFLHENAEEHEDAAAHALRHLRINHLHATLVLTYYEGVTLLSANLVSIHWLLRVWRAELWIRALLARFLPRDIREARPDLWASDDPIFLDEDADETESGNQNLCRFYREGCIENGEPRRYAEIQRLNDALRARARDALVAYLTGMDRTPLPWGGFATQARDLSELLLKDVETGMCRRASRIEAAISIVQTFVQRARLGLEPAFSPTADFLELWDSRFATYHKWKLCKRRELYPENWIEWDELEKARRSEAFRFLEARLSRAALTLPVSAPLEYWPAQPPPPHPELSLLQDAEPASLRRLARPIEGLGLLGAPERHARPAWIAALHRAGRERGVGVNQPTPIVDDGTPPDELVAPGAPSAAPASPEDFQQLPLWVQAAIRLGVRFVRVAAAAVPPASTRFAPRPTGPQTPCCAECGKPHPPGVDEYWFWLADARYYRAVVQDADLGISVVPDDPLASKPLSFWHEPERLPRLLHQDSQSMVHLLWCRVHNSEFQPQRRSSEGVRVDPALEARLVFLGRAADSLFFAVAGGQLPIGIQPDSRPGFRYDIAVDAAVVLPEVALAAPASGFLGGLPAYPYFVFFAPGAPLVPTSLFSPALALAATLRGHCRFEAALKWYAAFFDPLHENLSALWCLEDEGEVAEEVPIGQPAVPDELAQRRIVLLHYVETLLQWGDALMRLSAPEAVQQAWVIFDTAAKILGLGPASVEAADDVDPPPTIAAFVAPAPPLNPRLLGLYDLVEDRLALIRACLDARRLRPKHPAKHPAYWGDDHYRVDWRSVGPDCHGQQAEPQLCRDEADWCCPQSPYRFLALVQQAQQLAGEVRNLGAALLAAFEKGDAEYLAGVRAAHENQLHGLALAIRQDQVRAADWDVQAFEKTRAMALARKSYYEGLIRDGLISNELSYQALIAAALALQEVGRGSEIVAQSLSITPDMWVGIPIPWKLLQEPAGSKLAGSFATAARIANSLAESASTGASLALNNGGFDRRKAEWEHLNELHELEIAQIERQLLAAHRRRNTALLELNSHQRQIEHAAELHDLLRDKLTSHALYLWLQQETAALYYQMYDLALHAARQAQRAFNNECGHTTRNFLPAELWDNLHEGLLAGERLQMALSRMEKAYLDTHTREYELSKQISLRHHFPLALLRLLVTGSCELALPEWMFDMDYPGHYMRRFKDVSLTIPCVVGPYTGVHCTLTLLSSTTRIAPYLSEPAAGCCDAKPGDAYTLYPDDPRAVTQYAASEAIATSSAQNDAGLFELSFRDERYLPFEGSGAISCWRLELPHKTNYFDINTVSDVILKLDYTAREGGDVLRKAAAAAAEQRLPGDGWRLFNIEKEFPDAWHRVWNRPQDAYGGGFLELKLTRAMFPYLPGQHELQVGRFVLFIELPGIEPSAHEIVEFLSGNSHEYGKQEWSKCAVESIHCVATAEWPGFLVGMLVSQSGPVPLPKKGETTLGTFKFPHTAADILRIYLLSGYAKP